MRSLSNTETKIISFDGAYEVTKQENSVYFTKVYKSYKVEPVITYLLTIDDDSYSIMIEV